MATTSKRQSVSLPRELEKIYSESMLGETTIVSKLDDEWPRGCIIMPRLWDISADYQGWVDKLFMTKDEQVLVIPSKTSSKWFRAMSHHMMHLPDTEIGGLSACAIYKGPNTAQFESRCKAHGIIVYKRFMAVQF